MEEKQRFEVMKQQQKDDAVGVKSGWWKGHHLRVREEKEMEKTRIVVCVCVLVVESGTQGRQSIDDVLLEERRFSVARRTLLSSTKHRQLDRFLPGSKPGSCC